MQKYVRFVLTGLVLALFTEIELKLIAGIKPEAFLITLFAYPVILTVAFAGSVLLDRLIRSTWRADLIYYLTGGVCGLAFEWVLLGNGPGSNAIQLGMFAMWTTYLFGPRILTRDSVLIEKSRKKFWFAFVITAILITLPVLLIPNPKAKIVLVVLSLCASYMVWSVWLLILAWRTRHEVAYLAPQLPQ